MVSCNLLPPLEFKRTGFDHHSDEKSKVEMKTKSNSAPVKSVSLANCFSKRNCNDNMLPSFPVLPTEFGTEVPNKIITNFENFLPEIF